MSIIPIKQAGTIKSMKIFLRIIEIRKEKGISQVELAEKTGLTQSSISLCESNSLIPSVKKVVAISEVLGVSVDELVRYEFESSDSQSLRGAIRSAVANNMTLSEWLEYDQVHNEYSNHLDFRKGKKS